MKFISLFSCVCNNSLMIVYTHCMYDYLLGEASVPETQCMTAIAKMKIGNAHSPGMIYRDETRTH